MAVRPLNSVAGFSVGEYPYSTVILANGDVTTNNISTTGLANLNVIGNVKISGGISGQVITTDGLGNLSFTSISTNSLNSGTSNIQVINSGNITMSSAGASNVVVVTASGIYVNGVVTGNGSGLSSINGSNVVGSVSNATAANSFLTNSSVATTAYPTFVTVGSNGWFSAVTSTGINANLANNSITASQFVGSLNGNVVANGVNGYVTANNFNVSGQVIGNSNVQIVTSNFGIRSVSSTYIDNIATPSSTIANAAIHAIAAPTLAAANTAIVATNAATFFIQGAPIATGNMTITNPYALFVGNGNVYFANGLNVSGNANAGNIGAATGVFSTSVNTGIVQNGSSNVAIAAGGNINHYVGGNATSQLVVSATGVNAAGYINASGNIVTGSNVISNSVLSTGAITIATGANGNINLSPNGNGNITVANRYINNLSDPINLQDAATKNYVDTTAQGLDVKQNVTLATAGILPSYTYNNGSSGIGATLTGTANATLTIDSTAVTANARVLIKNEAGANAPYNGIYLVSNTGNSTSAYVLTRTTDFDLNSPSAQIPGAFTFVTGGTTNGNTGWVCTTPAPITLGTTNITFSQFSGAGTYTAGTGLTLTGTVFSISNTSVTSGSYGTGDRVASFTVNQQGQLTAASNTPITANAANLSGTVLSSTVVTSSLTSVGNLTSLVVSGNTTSSNANITGTLTGNIISASGNISGANLVANTGVYAGNTVGRAFIGYDSANLSVAEFAGNVNNYIAVSMFNSNTGTQATADFAIYDTTGPLSTNNNFIDIGILGNNYSNANWTINNPSDAYIYTGNTNLSIGTQSLGGGQNYINFFTGGGLASNERMRIDANGNIGIGNTSPTNTLSVTGTAYVSGNLRVGNLSASIANLTGANISNNLILGNSTSTTGITWGSVTTTSVTANQAIASIPVTGITGVEFLVKGVDQNGIANKYSFSGIHAVTDGVNSDWSAFGGVSLGGYTGSFSVAVSGSLLKLQVTPASSNSTVWTTQYRYL